MEDNVSDREPSYSHNAMSLTRHPQSHLLRLYHQFPDQRAIKQTGDPLPDTAILVIMSFLSPNGEKQAESVIQKSILDEATSK
jgi:hypothetical protein